MKAYFTEQNHFYGTCNPQQLIQKYGSPLYVYNEAILRARCREMLRLVSYPFFAVSYSTKANSNLELLKIIRQEGLHADAMSPGEIVILEVAGFQSHEILFISNNVSAEEMQFAIDRKITVSVDSLSQLKLFGRLNPGGSVAVRINTGIGAGHHEKVITGGKKTKFGVSTEQIPEMKGIIKEYGLRLTGVNQHIGSLFMECEPYIEGVKAILEVAKQFEDLEFVDFGGGFGIPYQKQKGQKRLDLKSLGDSLDEIIAQWTREYGKDIQFKIEPGRYITAESGVLLGTVNAIKKNHSTTYVGTDLGFNVLMRPALYDAYHDIEVYKNGQLSKSEEYVSATIVGNICESGDIIAKDRDLPPIEEGDLLGIMDAGAYGYSMSSNYNCRLRPAEVLIQADGRCKLIRRRDTLDDLLRNFNLEKCPTII